MTTRPPYENSRYPGASPFEKRLRIFRDQLPDDQRRIFNHLLAGAEATLRVAAKLGDESTKTSISSAIAAFRNDLPTEQRKELDGILLGSAFACGVQAGRNAARAGGDGTSQPPTGGEQPVALDPDEIEAIIRLAVGAAVAATAIITALWEDDEDVLVPDITDVLK